MKKNGICSMWAFIKDVGNKHAYFGVRKTFQLIFSSLSPFQKLTFSKWVLFHYFFLFWMTSFWSKSKSGFKLTNSNVEKSKIPLLCAIRSWCMFQFGNLVINHPHSQLRMFFCLVSFNGKRCSILTRSCPLEKDETHYNIDVSRTEN